MRPFSLSMDVVPTMGAETTARARGLVSAWLKRMGTPRTVFGQGPCQRNLRHARATLFGDFFDAFL